MQIISFLFYAAVQLISFYSLSTQNSEGSNISFDDFRGKKVLIVNTSLHTADTAQYAQMEQLWQLHHDSLVIIAVPSNDFGNLPENNATIRSFLQSHYNNHFLLAEKQHVKGDSISPLYQWLTDVSKNGIMSNPVKSDYYKFLINESGELIGAFSRTEKIWGGRIQSAIEHE